MEMSQKLSGVGLKLIRIAVSLRVASRWMARSKPGIQTKTPEAVRAAKSLPEEDTWATQMLNKQMM